MVKPYAYGTKVSVQDSRGEITGILAKHGVTRMGWSTSPEKDELLFVVGGNNYRFTMIYPSVEDAERSFLAGGGTAYGWRNQVIHDDHVEAEWRRRWRANVLLLKAKLEFASDGVSSLENELLPYMLVDGRRTVGDLVADGGLKMLAAGT